MSNQPLYPTAFKTPEGRPVSIKTMSAALSHIRKNREVSYSGWDWFPVPGYFILREFRRGLNDRINRRGLKNVR